MATLSKFVGSLRQLLVVYSGCSFKSRLCYLCSQFSLLAFVSLLCSGNIFGNDISYVPYAALEVEFTKSQIVAAIPGTFFCAWYVSQKHWLANNILGLAFCIQVWLLFFFFF